jgi:hypothetical protein
VELLVLVTGGVVEGRLHYTKRDADLSGTREMRIYRVKWERPAKGHIPKGRSYHRSLVTAGGVMTAKISMVLATAMA